MKIKVAFLLSVTGFLSACSIINSSSILPESKTSDYSSDSELDSSTISDEGPFISSLFSEDISIDSSVETVEVSSLSVSSIYENSQESTPLISSSSSSSAPSSITSEEIIEEKFEWKIDTELRGANFRNELKKLIDSERIITTSYSSCLSIGAKAAAYPNASSVRFVPFYHGTSTLTTTSSCNREHTWPDSRGTGKSGPGADPFIIRPTLISDNSSRGNNFYGLGNLEWDPGSLGFTAARGEAARVILYAATAYYDMGFSLSNNPADSTSLKTMGTLKYLIQWNKQYEPTEMELRINEYLYNEGYGRNPFVDNPEFANYIWSENGLLGATGEDPIESNLKYDLVDALDEIDGLNLAIVSKDSAGNAFGLTSSAKSSSLPWYLVGVPCTLFENNTKMSCLQDSLVFYKFEKLSNGSYYVRNGNNYLYNYIDGSHYSIGLGNSPTNNGSKCWTIRKKNDGSFVFLGERGVYLEYYNNSFCGYSAEPTQGIYLYKSA